MCGFCNVCFKWQWVLKVVNISNGGIFNVCVYLCLDFLIFGFV